MTAVEEAIGQVSQALADFITLLEEEAVALAAQDSDRLAAMLPGRNEVNHRLAGAWLKLSELANTPKPTGIAAMRAKLFADGRPSDAWRRLEELAHISDRLNRVNGRLIEEQMRRTQAAMQVLQNSIASRGIYGADGRVTDIFNVNRRIDSA